MPARFPDRTNGIHAVTDGHRGNELAAVRIHDGHQLVAATGKQPPMLAIDRQSSRLLARSQRPARLHFQFAGIERHEFTLVFNVDEDFAFFVTDRKLRFPIHFDRAHDLAFGGVDRGDIIAPAVEGEDALARGIVKNRVRILANLNLVERFQSLQIENSHGSFATIADEAAAELRGQGNAMHAGSVRDIADGLSGLRVDHDDVGGSRNIQPI